MFISFGVLVVALWLNEQETPGLISIARRPDFDGLIQLLLAEQREKSNKHATYDH